MPSRDAAKASELKFLRARMEMASSVEWRSFWEAQVLILEGDVKAGFERLRELETASDAELAAAVLIVLADDLREHGDVAKAAAAYRAAAEKNRMSSLAMLRLGECLMGLRSYEEAQLAFEDAVARLQPSRLEGLEPIVEGYVNLVLRSQGQEAAQVLLQRFIDEYPDRPALERLHETLRNPDKDH
ncbi:MAG: tetratricopeptide repeat protein [Thermoanaerobaculia bacterium]